MIDWPFATTTPDPAAVGSSAVGFDGLIGTAGLNTDERQVHDVAAIPCAVVETGSEFEEARYFAADVEEVERQTGWGTASHRTGQVDRSGAGRPVQREQSEGRDSDAQQLTFHPFIPYAISFGLCALT